MTKPSQAQSTPEPRRSDALPEIEIDQILYCSLAREPMDEAALDAMIVGVSSINRMDHITGLLMYSEGVYVQLIEGPPEAVQNLWARLLRDPRHFGVVQLYHYRELEQRSCEDWAMKRVDFETLRGIIHHAKEETAAGRHSAWAGAIERMDFLLTSRRWINFVDELKSQAQA